MSCKDDCREKFKMKGRQYLLERAKGWLYSGLRKEFKKSDEVYKRIYGCFVAFYGASNYNYNAILPRSGKYILAI